MFVRPSSADACGDNVLSVSTTSASISCERRRSCREIALSGSLGPQADRPKARDEMSAILKVENMPNGSRCILVFSLKM